MDRTTAKKGLPMVIPHWCVMNSAVYWWKFSNHWTQATVQDVVIAIYPGNSRLTCSEWVFADLWFTCSLLTQTFTDTHKNIQMVLKDLRSSFLPCLHGSLKLRSVVQSSHFLLRDLKSLHKQEVVSQSLTCLSCQEVSGVTWLICCSTGNVEVGLWLLNTQSPHTLQNKTQVKHQVR